MTTIDPAALVATLTQAMATAGLDPATVRPEDLSAVDELHLGGQRATALLGDRLDLTTESELLDLGCGLGGPARALARRFGCRVTGVDLSPAFIAAADYLTGLVGPRDRLSFRIGNVTELPFPDHRFDAATLFHVGMGIADKRRLFAEAARVLRPGGSFLVYDVMRTGEGALAYPVVWARSPADCFIATPEAYRSILVETGFDIISESDCHALALALSRRLAERLAAPDGGPLTMRLVIGADAADRVASMIANLEHGLMAPIALAARRRD